MCQKAKGLLGSLKYLLSDPSQTSGLDNKFVSPHYSRQQQMLHQAAALPEEGKSPLGAIFLKERDTLLNRKQKTTLVKQDGSDKDAHLPFPLESVRRAEATRFQ